MATPTMNTPTDLKTKVRYFDLDKFENVSVDVPYSFSPFASLDEVTAELSQAELLEAANDIRRRKAMLDARKNALPENAADREIVNTFVNTFWQLPPYSDMPEGTADEKKAKRANILAAIRATPMIFNALVAKAKQSPVGAGSEQDED